MNEVLNFWFNELSPKDWWVKSDELDNTIKDRFLGTHQKAITGELSSWRITAEGRLAEVIVIDQFSRNIFRNEKRSFLYDGMALILAQEAIRNEDDQKLDPTKKAFLYLPFMHSESKEIHDEAVKLYSQAGLEDNLKFELAHKAIIDRFNRYPHRNEVLARESTEEEIEFLKGPNSSF